MLATLPPATRYTTVRGWLNRTRDYRETVYRITLSDDGTDLGWTPVATGLDTDTARRAAELLTAGDWDGASAAVLSHPGGRLS